MSRQHRLAETGSARVHVPTIVARDVTRIQHCSQSGDQEEGDACVVVVVVVVAE